MKYTYFLLSTAVLLLCNSASALARSYDHEKVFNEVFDVRPDVSLTAESSFSQLEIESWDQNVVEVRVEVTFEARNKEKAEELMEKIEVDIDGSYDRVKVTTGLEGSWNKGSHELEIKVFIKAPENSQLEASSEFGTIRVRNFGRDVNLTCSFGRMDVAGLGGTENEITSEYSSGTLTDFNGGKIEVEFGSLEMSALAGKIDLNSSYSSVEITGLDNSVSEMEIENEFGSCDISILSSAAFSVDAESEFGDVDLDRGFEIIDREKEMMSMQLTARLGNSAGSQLTIETSFGDVNLGID